MRLTRITFAAALLIATTFAADKPNFTGNWEMNKAQSDFGQMPPQMLPEKLTQKIAQKGEEELRVESTMTGARSATTDMKYKLDGSESTNKNQMGEVKSVAKWDGNAIVITSKREVQGMSISLTEKWEVSGDKMTVNRTMSGGPNGEIVTKMVFERK
jgi:hypothetical protein